MPPDSPAAAVIFDLDGTLLDTLQDLTDVANAVLAKLGRPPKEVQETRFLFGQGVPRLYDDLLPDVDDETRAKACDMHRAGYRETEPVHTHLFDGLGPVLDALQAQPTKLAVLSNKPHFATLRDVNKYLSGYRWDCLWGHKEGYAPKPDPTSAFALLKELGVQGQECFYLGDTAADMKTGKAIGATVVGVTWGFRDETELRENGADVIVHEPRELSGVLIPDASTAPH